MKNIPKRTYSFSFQGTGDEYYAPKFDSYKPNFRGIPPNYYPNTWGNVLLIWFLIFSVWALCAGIFAGLVEWGLYDSTSALWTFFGVFCLFVLLLIIGTYMGSQLRAKKEKQLIEQKLKEQEEENQKVYMENLALMHHESFHPVIPNAPPSNETR